MKNKLLSCIKLVPSCTRTFGRQGCAKAAETGSRRDEEAVQIHAKH